MASLFYFMLVFCGGRGKRDEREEVNEVLDSILGL